MAKPGYINFRLVLKVLGTLIIGTGIVMLFPAIVSLFYDADSFFSLFVSVLICVFVGLFLRYGIGQNAQWKNDSMRFHRREGFLVVVLAWVAVAFFGGLPFLFDHTIDNLTDAFFESISGVTSTGARIIRDLEAMPTGLMLWRCMMNWIGGLGIIVFIVAIIPMMSTDGVSNVFLAETSGPVKDKIHSRATQTAKTLVSIYVLLTIAQVFCLSFGDMNGFEAVCHAFTTVGTGGFSTRNDSLMGFNAYTQYITVLFMFLSGINYGLLYFAGIGKFDKVWQNSEFKAYILCVVCAVAFLTYSLWASNVSQPFETNFRHALFMSVSIISTTGFTNTDFTLWSSSQIFFLFLLSFTGASSGSSSGGIKLGRHAILLKNLAVVVRRSVHPRAVIPLRFNNQEVEQSLIANILAFFFLYMFILVVAAFVFSIMGYDFTSSLSLATSTLGNVGVLVHDSSIQVGMEDMNVFCKWIMSLLMIIGRLELFTVIILFSPAFWKK
ncbi:potassium transporter [Bacteroidia bacterium]|nr:potassium transporter [Bacteroidia bacterium]